VTCFLEWTEGCADWRNSNEAGALAVAGQSLQSTLRRSWYFGTEEFRERLLEKLGNSGQSMSEARRKGYGGEQTRDHGIADAERIIRKAGKVPGLGRSD
jgi:hypothetical protein